MKSLIRYITFIVFVAVVLLGFLFAARNTTQVSLWIGLELPALSVGVLVIAAFITGGLLGLLLGMGLFRRLKYVVQIRHLKSQLRKAQQRSGSTPDTPVKSNR